MIDFTPLQSREDIPEKYRKTPIEDLIGYQNLGQEPKRYEKPELVIATCKDYRISLKLPQQFAFIMRTAGVNLVGEEFQLSFAIGAGRVSHCAIIGHTKCGMSKLITQKDNYVKGLVELAGWDSKTAAQYFDEQRADYNVEDVSVHVLTEAARIQKKFPKILVAPFVYKVEDNQLYLVQ